MDTLHVRLIANQMRFQFSAWETAVKFGAFRAYRRQTSTAAADFLHHLKTKFPFPIKAIQIDGGSEFIDQFEEACRRRKSGCSSILPDVRRSTEAWNGRTGQAGKSSMKWKTWPLPWKN